MGSLTPTNPNSIYTANLTTGTVIDNRTGLMWKTCSEGQTWSGVTCNGAAATYNWSGALALTPVTFADYSDWRLPSANELLSLVENCRSGSAINDELFPNTPNTAFWSSSPFANGTTGAWCVGFDNGSLLSYGRDSLGNSARLVRDAVNPLTITLLGTGTGTVTSNVGGIDCGSVCDARFGINTNTVVTLTAYAVPCSIFAGWGGDCTGTASTCTVTMDDAETVTATFNEPQTLTVINNGNGNIIIDPAAVECSSGTCISDYAGLVTLTATPDPGYQFAGWSGACSDANVICTLSMTAEQEVTASFTAVATGTGSDWQVISSSGTGLKAVTYGDGLFVAVSNTRPILISTDGVTWTAPDEPPDSNNLLSVTWGGGQFVAVGESGAIATSTDGSNWSDLIVGSNDLYDVAWGGDRFVAVGGSGTILTSFDGGDTWDTQTVGTDHLKNIVWSGSQFAVTVNSNKVLTSTDGTSWTPRTTSALLLHDITWDGSQFVATGYYDTSAATLTSSDGTNWSTPTSVAPTYLYGVTWTGQQLVAVGAELGGVGVILTSTNGGASWTSQSFGTTGSLSSVAWNGSRLVAVGDNGTILISPSTSQTLTVSTNGTGTITSNVGGIDCGGTCSANINNGTLVTLTATPTSGSLFGVWGGCIPEVNNPWQCQVTMSAAKTVTATFITAGLNDTGITKCSNVDTSNLDCSVTGFPDQDAEHGSNSFNFTKLDASGNPLPATATNHVCVRDNVTGLIWEVKTDNTIPDLRDKDHTYTWYSTSAGGTASGTTNCYNSGRCDTEKFVADVNTAGLCGYFDWRMPAVKELAGIADLSRTNPAIDPNYFPNTPNTPIAQFWSGSPNADDGDKAWSVAFSEYGSTYGNNRSVAKSIRLVRGGQSSDAFIDNGDGTVTQTNTGLMWAKCAEGLTGTNCETGTAMTKDWAAALTVASDGTLAIYNDWRLPNAKELQSLVDYGRTDPSINVSYFPNTPSNHFRSSSAIAQNYAFILLFSEGANSGFSKTANTYVRFVRGGQAFQSFNLTTATAGTGSGSVATDLTGTNCGANCQTFNERTIVVLTATPSVGSVFTSWTNCTPLVDYPNQCYVTMDAAKTVTATFAPPAIANSLAPVTMYPLTINTVGDGSVTNVPTLAGVNVTNFGNYSSSSQDLTVLADGKILVVGAAYPYFALARYTADGYLDTTFGSDGNGRVTTDFGNYLTAYSLTLQSDNKILVAGARNDGYVALVRYSAAGLLDTSFGNGGQVAVDLGGIPSQVDQSVLVDASGILLAGENGLARYTDAGGLDTSFDSDGKVTTVFNGSSDEITSIAFDVGANAGKILVAGTISSTGYDFGLARYNTDGSLDISFGTGGKVTTDFGSEERGNALAVQSDGKILIAGSANDSTNFALARYNTDGSLDTTFDGDGKVITDLGEYEYAHSLTIQSDGKILVAGLDENGGILIRYNTDGSLDTTFDGDGSITGQIGFGYTEDYSVALTSAGQILLAGEDWDGSFVDKNFAMGRYTSSGTLDPTFNQINCTTSSCSFNVDSGATVTLNATPNSGLVFTGWTDNCSGTGDCTVALDAAKTVTATFNAVTAISVNDTGIKSCANVNTNGLLCPVAGFPDQDAEYGSNGF
ncbi:DUF1566 domain-containing protein, partial [Rhodoferax sp. 4810]|nr:DUF1566 domain-containing protein [Rhodoferax jenense]